MITAPFNFVPLSSKVYYPDWANQVSQDIPFSDGEDGVIELTIVNQTPLFTRNGHARSAEEPYSSHIDVNGTRRYFIPGTTLKGCFRSVMEILSFGKMTQYDDSSFGQRDLKAKDYRNAMQKVRCGWLYKVGSDVFLKDCGEPIKVLFQKVDEEIGKKVLENFIRNISGDNDRLARTKYLQVYKYLHPTFDEHDKKQFEEFIMSRDYLLSDESGTIVMTGQSSKCVYDSQRKKPIPNKNGEKFGCYTGKAREYFFKSSIEHTYSISDRLFHAFETINARSADYTEFWQKKLNAGQEIPVFFCMKGKEIDSIGLTYLYKRPYKHSVKDGVPTQDLTKMDLPECIFGRIADKNIDMSLKGRVVFSHAFAEKVIPDNALIYQKDVVLGQPSASYYPIYLKSGNYNDSKIEIAGRKRYSIIKGGKTNTIPIGTPNVSTSFKALPIGQCFKGKIIIHNLRPVEIGALLSAITFNNTAGCYHNIGLAKSFGFGKILCSVKIDGLKHNMEDYIHAFEHALLTDNIDITRNNPLNSLVSIASEHEPSAMRMMNGVKEYAENKGTFSTLRPDNTKAFHYITDQTEVAIAIEEKRRLQNQQEEAKKELENRQKEYNFTKAEAYGKMVFSNWQEALNKFKEAKIKAVELDIDTAEVDRKMAECQAHIDKKQAQQSQSLSAVLQGQGYISNVHKAVNLWCNSHPNAFSDTELQALVAAIKTLPTQEQKKLPSMRSKFEKTLTADWATKLYNLLK